MKNMLMQYRGGGYDGCMWEWNFCAWDGDGKFLNIFASGMKGVKDEVEALDLFDSTEKVYRYDLTKEADIDEFQKENNAGFVVAVVEKINRATEYEGFSFPKMWFLCDDCGAQVESGYGDDPSGDGGIAISYKTKLCESCSLAREEAEEDDYE